MRPDLDLAKVASPEIYGKTCAGCKCDLDFVHYRRDSSQRDGRAALCVDCEAAPVLSTSEHLASLKEKNYNAEQTKAQRWSDQDELRDDASRIGRAMLASDFITILKRLVPCLYITEGRIEGDLAVYQVAASPQKAWDGRDFRYLFYVPGTGILPEFSQYEFSRDGKDIPLRESRRGYRTVLLRLIKSGLLTEAICNQVFGRPSEGTPSNRWYRELFIHRNRHQAA